MPQDEAWSWKKLFGGFFNGKNTAKAIVNLFHTLIILGIVLCVYFTVKTVFTKKVPPTQSVGTNQGIVATKNEDKSGNTYSLFNLLNLK